MIEITGLRKTFGVGSKAVNALNGVDLQIERGEIFHAVHVAAIFMAAHRGLIRLP